MNPSAWAVQFEFHFAEELQLANSIATPESEEAEQKAIAAYRERHGRPAVMEWDAWNPGRRIKRQPAGK